MNVKTMEGLAGAGTSISMISTPMNAAKEAERKGDTEKMKHALGYAAQLTEQAEKYSEKTSQGMKLDAEEAKKQEKQQQEKLAETRKAKQKEQEKQIEKARTEEQAETIETDSAEFQGEKGSEGEERVRDDMSFQDGTIKYDKLGKSVEAGAETGENVNICV